MKECHHPDPDPEAQSMKSSSKSKYYIYIGQTDFEQIECLFLFKYIGL